jgi:sterol desaturase/sphingolipid hydroxylase (fatty acid hydroxylase superfamily)
MTDRLATFLWGAAANLAWLLGALAANLVWFIREIARNTALALLLIVPVLIAIWYCERRQGSDTSRYARRHFGHDVAYALFYNSGAFNLLGASLIYGVVQDQLGFMRLGLLEGLPIVVVGLLYVLIADLVSYWMHRAEHSIPFLWQFHSIHHSAEEINFLTAYRVHPFSRLVWGISEVVVLILLGVPPTWWLPFTLVRGLLASVQHTELDWSYGRLYPLLVSPVFHRLHHSRDRRDFDSNYSQLFGIWDYLFGTANPSRTPPVAVGVEGLPPEPTLIGQLWGPFRRLARWGTVPELPPTAPSPERKDRKNRSPSARSMTKTEKRNRARKHVGDARQG